MTSGSLVISLDFELMWGVRDHRSIADYGDAVLGVREALPEILARFHANRIRATWATVGLLFARSRQEMLEFAPNSALRPQYANPLLSPYEFIENGVGRCEAEDPLHYGYSLIQKIAETDGQEIATHTFSHYYCLEDGNTLTAFAADLDSAVNIARHNGFQLRSIVFPRNQMTSSHIKIAVSNGIDLYRGSPNSFPYRPRSKAKNTKLVRALRLLDGVLPVVQNLDYETPIPSDEGMNIPASRFLRPWNRRLPIYSHLHILRVCNEMTRAASLGKIYHIWWHPHNMGRNLRENLGQLDQVIRKFRELQDRFGMQSVNMRDLASAHSSPEPFLVLK